MKNRDSRVKSSQQRTERLEVFRKPKAIQIETETCLKRTEQLEALSKTKQDLRLTQRQLIKTKNATFEHLKVYLIT